MRPLPGLYTSVASVLCPSTQCCHAEVARTTTPTCRYSASALPKKSPEAPTCRYSASSRRSSLRRRASCKTIDSPSNTRGRSEFLLKGLRSQRNPLKNQASWENAEAPSSLSFFLSLILAEWGTFGFDSVGTSFGTLESVQEILHSFHARPQLFFLEPWLKELSWSEFRWFQAQTLPPQDAVLNMLRTKNVILFRRTT